MDTEKIKEMVERSILRRYHSDATSERPLVEADIVDGIEYENDRIRLLLHREIAGIEARETHDGGPSLSSLIKELIEKIQNSR